MGPEYNSHFASLYKIFIQQLQLILPPSTNIPSAYEQGSDEEQAFVQNLALFFTAFFKVSSPSLIRRIKRAGYGRVLSCTPWQLQY